MVTFRSTALPPFKSCNGDGFGNGCFLTALGVAFAGVATLRVAVGEVLRVLRFFGVVAFGVAGVFDLTVINSLLRVYSHIIPNKNPYYGVCYIML